MASKPDFYVAQSDLFVGPHVRAYNAGDLVHADAVEAHGWKDDVKPAPASSVPAPDPA